MVHALARLRFLLILAGAFFASAAIAQTACGPTSFNVSIQGGSGGGSSPTAACEAASAARVAAGGSPATTVLGGGQNGFPAYCEYTQLGELQSVFISGNYECAGCVAGDPLDLTYFDRWYAAPGDEEGIPGTEADLPPTTVCDGSCSFQLTGSVDCSADTSPFGDTGFYMGTCVYGYQSTGSSCTSSPPPPFDPENPPPPPGPGDPGDGGGGDPGGDPGGGDGGGDEGPSGCTPAQIAAGTCEGSGPVDGGEEGGGTGSTPGGPAPGEPGPEGEPCGAPGQPICAVRVDESGTPGAKEYQDAIKQQGDLATELYGEEGGLTRRVQDFLGESPAGIAGWTWTFSLPTGCTPYVVAALNITLDVCDFQPVIHDIMGLLWVLSTIFALVRVYMWGISE